MRGLLVGGQHETQVWEPSVPLHQDEALNTAPSSVQTLNCSFPVPEQLQRDHSELDGSHSAARESQGLFNLLKFRCFLCQFTPSKNQAYLSRKSSPVELQHPDTAGSLRQNQTIFRREITRHSCRFTGTVLMVSGLIYCKSHYYNNTNIQKFYWL